MSIPTFVIAITVAIMKTRYIPVVDPNGANAIMPDRRQLPHEPARAHLREALAIMPGLELSLQGPEPWASAAREALDSIIHRIQNALEQVESEYSDADTRTYPVDTLRRRLTRMSLDELRRVLLQ